MIIAGREIKRLVASGCSFTYGQGVDPSESWPAQLAKLLDIECVNLGLPGMGNEHIQSSIIDYFASNPNAKNDTFVLPSFSAYSRVEFWNKQKMMQGYEVAKWTTIINSKDHSNFNKMFFEQMFNERYYYSRYVRIIISLQSILKTWGIPYLMFEALSGNPHKEMLVHNDIRELVSEIDRNRWLRFAMGNLDTMTSLLERLPCGHPNAKAHAEMAEILYKHIINN